MACQYQTKSVLKDVTGKLLASLPESGIVAVTATWPLPEAGNQSQRRRMRLAQAETRDDGRKPDAAVDRATSNELAPESVAGSGNEPSVRELQRAAEENLLLHPEDLKSIGSRAHPAAWLPELSAEYQRNVGNIAMLGINSGGGVDTSALEDVSRYSLRATWKLSELVFSPQEIKLASTTMELQAARREILLEVAKLYFERRRLQLRRRSETDPTSQEQLELDIGERGARLDALTGGLLSRRLRRRRVR